MIKPPSIEELKPSDTNTDIMDLRKHCMQDINLDTGCISMGNIITDQISRRYCYTNVLISLAFANLDNWRALVKITP